MPGPKKIGLYINTIEKWNEANVAVRRLEQAMRKTYWPALLTMKDGSKLRGLVNAERRPQKNLEERGLTVHAARHTGVPTTMAEAIVGDDEDYGSLPTDEGGLTPLSLVMNEGSQLYLRNLNDAGIFVSNIKDGWK